MSYIEDKTEAELVDDIGKTVIGTESGLKAQFSQAELTRRLIVATRDLNRATTEYSKKLVNLTYILFLVALIQLIVSVFSMPIPVWLRFFIWIVLLFFIFSEIKLLYKK